MSIALSNITTLDKLSLINANFTAIQNAINSSLLWKEGTVAGENIMYRDLDLNGGQLLNALIGNLPISTLGVALTDAVAAADASATSAAVSQAGALVYANAANASAATASTAANTASTVAQSIVSSAAQIAQNSTDIAQNVTDISNLATRVSAEETKIQPITLGGTGNTTGLAASSTKLSTSRTVQTNLASTSAASFDGTTNISPGVTGTLPIANGGTGNTTGLAATATALATGRTFQTNLASTNAASFNGTGNVTPGVTGTLPVANGGTGQTTIAGALGALGFSLASQVLTIPTSTSIVKVIMFTVGVTTDASGIATITYPASFTSAVYTVLAMSGDYSAGGDVVATISGSFTTSLSSFNVHLSNSANQARRVNYIAIGV